MRRELAERKAGCLVPEPGNEAVLGIIGGAGVGAAARLYIDVSARVRAATGSLARIGPGWPGFRRHGGAVAPDMDPHFYLDSIVTRLESKRLRPRAAWPDRHRSVCLAEATELR